MLVSDVIRKLGLARMRCTKYCCGGYRLKNWKQSDPGTRLPLNWPRPSKGSPVAGLIALLGHICGGAPNCRPASDSGRTGNCGGIGSGSTKTLAGCGLSPSLQSVREPENEDDDSVWPKAWVNPTLGIRTPAPVISPIFMRSRRVKPAFTSSSLLLRARWMSRRFAIACLLFVGKTTIAFWGN